MAFQDHPAKPTSAAWISASDASLDPLKTRKTLDAHYDLGRPVESGLSSSAVPSAASSEDDAITTFAESWGSSTSDDASSTANTGRSVTHTQSRFHRLDSSTATTTKESQTESNPAMATRPRHRKRVRRPLRRGRPRSRRPPLVRPQRLGPSGHVRINIDFSLIFIDFSTRCVYKRRRLLFFMNDVPIAMA